MRLSYDTWNRIFAAAYAALVTNLLLVIATLPFLAVLLAPRPPATWPLPALLAPLCAPALCAAFAVFAAFTADPTIRVARTFVRAWRACARRAVTAGAVATAVLTVLAVDVRVVWGRPVGAATVPFFVTLALIAAATTTLCLIVIAERPEAALRPVLRAGIFLAVRRWYLAVPSLLVLYLLAAVVTTRPVLGLGAAAAPLLYVVWANGRHTLRPVLDPDLPATG